ncbi:amino acid ABC transporter substrate-binding protein [Candidatus Babeliales bacterium]|nr:amino acid ABC transporter substrate-binding protein [Candidatus Babeliales bacterium]
MKNFIYLTLIIATISLTHFFFNKKVSEGDSKIPTIIVGISPEHPPFEFKQNGKLCGFDVDLAKQLGKELNMNISFKEMDYFTLIPALKCKHIDIIISCMSPTAERKKNIEFSKPYFENTFAFFFDKTKTKPPTLDNLQDKKFGVQLGSTMEQFAKQLKGIHIVSLNSNLILLQELKAGKIDMVIMENSQSKTITKSMPELSCAVVDNNKIPNKPEGPAIAFAKNSQLKKPIETALAKIKLNGTLKALANKWIGGAK